MPKLSCGCSVPPKSSGKAPVKELGLLIERGVHEAKGHRVDRLPKRKGFIMHPDHRWFPTLREAKAWLKGHGAQS